MDAYLYINLQTKRGGRIINSYNDLGDFHLDALKEICNIGSGNAATALSQMFGVPIDIEIPKVDVVDFNAASDRFGGVENILAGLILVITGDMNGMIIFLLYREFVCLLLKMLMGIEINDFSEVDEMGFSAMYETANIVGASFINAISGMTGMFIDISPPTGTVDMVGAIMNVPQTFCANVSDKILIMENRFICGEENLKSHILLIPDIESLNRLMKGLGVD